MEKDIRNGKVAVLYSPGYGAGWSTWNYGEFSKGMVFNPTLVSMVENGKRFDITEEMVRQLLDLPDDEHVCILGKDSLEIQWIDEDSKFIINEVDGYETLKFRDEEEWL